MAALAALAAVASGSADTVDGGRTTGAVGSGGSGSGAAGSGCACLTGGSAVAAFASVGAVSTVAAFVAVALFSLMPVWGLGVFFLALFGWLSDKFGARKTIVLGQMIFIVSLVVAGFGQASFALVTIGLFLLGIGWSASTVAASALLSQVLEIEQRSKVQGFSDSLMNFSGALGGAVSGTILAVYSFSGLNAAALLPVVLIVFATSFARRWR